MIPVRFPFLPTSARRLSPWLGVAALALMGCGDQTPSDGDAGDDGEPPALVLSEIMYHPVLEDSFEDLHEFVEIHNPTGAPADLTGWQLAGGVGYAFAEGTTIEAGGYLAVAKDRERLLEVYSASLDPEHVVGDYTGELDNGGASLGLQAPDGSMTDVVDYNDEFPWPIGADALGAGEAWLPPSIVPVETHLYRGYSLERVSFDAAAGAPANWVTSAIDQPTPGGPGDSLRDVPLPVVESLTVTPLASADPLIRASDDVRIEVRLSAAGALADLRLETFVDDLEQEDEALTSSALSDDGTDADSAAGDRVFTAVLSPQPDNSIVRFRIAGDRGEGDEVISPRPTDPYGFHAYFVSPTVATSSRLYQLFVAPSHWTELWDNIQNGRVDGCETSATWDATVPAVFVHEGVVYDVRARYQGSRWNRSWGLEIPSWPHPGPERPSPLMALSWRLAFPRYAKFEKQDVIILNKLSSGCPGLNSAVGFELFREAGVPAPDTRFVRLHVNGGYYRTMQQIEHPDDKMMDAFHEEQHAADPEVPLEPVGHLFKSVGCNCDEGPFGWGDERLLDPYCGHEADARYAATYSRETWDWAGHAELIALVAGLHEARGLGTDALRSYLESRFDVPSVLSYLAVINWAVPFDDYFQNHFLYQRRSDGMWTILPWDLDLDFGGWQGAESSFFIGEEGDPSNRDAWWNYLKDSFFEAYRNEYVARLDELGQATLAPENVDALVDEAAASLDEEEANQASGGLGCTVADSVAAFKAFAQARADALAGLAL